MPAPGHAKDVLGGRAKCAERLRHRVGPSPKGEQTLARPVPTPELSPEPRQSLSHDCRSGFLPPSKIGPNSLYPRVLETVLPELHQSEFGDAGPAPDRSFLP